MAFFVSRSPRLLQKTKKIYTEMAISGIVSVLEGFTGITIRFNEISIAFPLGSIALKQNLLVPQRWFDPLDVYSRQSRSISGLCSL